MESTALEEKINKIRLRNEEIKRRHEEVEADKKNAAKLDALVEPLPVEDWPQRKEPPEFSAAPSKQTNKPKHIVRKHGDQGNQYYSSGDGKKAHNFADGQGPPPDPKYNFLADSEREEYGEQISKDSEKNRGRNKAPRGGFRRRGSGRDWHAKEQWGQHPNPGDMTLPEYEAWRAERNRIDEARISRQRTAEGNWRREWDNDKVHLADDVTKRDNRVTLGDIATRHEHSENEKHYRSPRTAPRNSHHANIRESHHVTAVSETNKNHGTVDDPEKRVVIATDKSIKVMVNHGTTPPKSSVMSVKVSSPNIVGSGRVGPRQRPRVMYSSQSEAEPPNPDVASVTRQKSVEEKTKGRQFDQMHKVTSPKSPHTQRRRDGDAKSPYPQRRENDKAEGTGKPIRKDSQKSPYPQRRGNAQSNYPPKSPRVNRRSTESTKQKHNSESSNVSCARDVSKIDDIAGNSSNSRNSSDAIGNEKSSDPINRYENNDDKNDSVLPKESVTDSSVTSATEPVLESTNNYSESDKIQQSPLEESTASSAIETVREIAGDAEKTKNQCRDESEASGSGEAKDHSTENIDGESADSQVINCSANSGFTSNDSGYIELPSDNSIQNVSENETVESSGIADTSSESLNFSGQIGENYAAVGNLEIQPKVTDEETMDAAKSESSNLEKTSEPIADNPEEKPKVTDEETVDAAKSESSNLEKTSEPITDNPEVQPKVTEEQTVDAAKQLSSNLDEKPEPIAKNPDVELKVAEEQIAEVAESSSSNLDEKTVRIIDNPEVEAKVTNEQTADTAESSSSNLDEKTEPIIDNPEVETKVTDEQTVDAAKSFPSETVITSEPESPLSGVADDNKSKDTIITTDNTPSVELKSQTEDTVTSAIVSEGINLDSQDPSNETANPASVQVESEQKESNSIQKECDLPKDAVNSEKHIGKPENSVNKSDDADNNRQDAPNDSSITASPQLEKQNEELTAEKSLETVESTQETKSKSTDESKDSNAIVEDNLPVSETTISSTIEKDKTIDK